VSTPVIVYVLTGLAAVVIVLTRLRMRGGKGAARVYVGRLLLNVHTVAGVLALAVWITFLVADEDTTAGGTTAGIIGLALWWIVTIAGLLMLVRWMPTHGRHASEGTHDNWSEGPGLSVLAHVGMLVGVCVFTWAYLTSAV
jgi:hypothetical protein